MSYFNLKKTKFCEHFWQNILTLFSNVFFLNLNAKIYLCSLFSLKSHIKLFKSFCVKIFVNSTSFIFGIFKILNFVSGKKLGLLRARIECECVLGETLTYNQGNVYI